LSDQVSGRESEPPGWSKLLAELKPGDTVVVWKLDSLGSPKDQLNLLGELSEKGVEFRSLIDGLDSRSPPGQALFTSVGAIRRYKMGHDGGAPGTQQ
jgi:DNA invertase Pin-like site-specific DNA recombinase